MKIEKEIIEGFHKKTASELFNYVWELLDKKDRTIEDDRMMIHAAHASLFHWMQVGDAENDYLGEWQVSRVYSTLGKGESALYHAQNALLICEKNGFTGFNLAYAHEALARAQLVLKNHENAKKSLEKAFREAEKVENEEEKNLLESDLKSLSDDFSQA
ncbi:hypothetical protein JW890_00425 [candidate division WOR-3 bacterium]|nr:hypothetical protein [candidate division WOR-3 bacterium]